MKIGIIGSGGAGMCAAWLLDPEHEVTILEKRDCLGGHAHTVKVNLNGTVHNVDDGAAWFSPKIFPYFNRYIDLAGVEYDWLPLSMTYYNLLRNTTNCMPPVSAHDFARIFTTTNTLPELLAIIKVIKAATPIVKKRIAHFTYREFINKAGISEDMEKQFIKPLISGLWGLPHDHTEQSSIYPLMKYLVYHQPSAFKYFKWKIMRGGTGQYIQTVANRLKNTAIYLNSEVRSIAMEKDNKVMVSAENGTNHHFDRLIIATGAHDACKFLDGNPGCEGQLSAVQRFQYYKATLCVHGDVSFMPPHRKDWSVVNVINKGTHADTTIWHGWNKKVDLFCSYVHQGNFPAQLYHTSEWWLPLETPAFFEAQKTIPPIQGLNNIWLAGDYTRDTGSHEDAIESAVKAVEMICPQSVRLKLLEARQR